jgi:hypothetical protein
MENIRGSKRRGFRESTVTDISGFVHSFVTRNEHNQEARQQLLPKRPGGYSEDRRVPAFPIELSDCS